MCFSKGDLVLVSNGRNTSTCIILSHLFESSFNDRFFYTFCLETGDYGIVFSKEIVCVVSENFAPDFDFETEIFNHYDYCNDFYEKYSYTPFTPPEDDGSDED